MFVMPFQLNEREFSVFVAIQDDNIERMRVYDPAEFSIAKMGLPWRNLKLKDIIIGYATEADMLHFQKLCQQGKQGEGLQYLSRGWKYRPDQGDNDAPYLSSKVEAGERKH